MPHDRDTQTEQKKILDSKPKILSESKEPLVSKKEVSSPQPAAKESSKPPAVKISPTNPQPTAKESSKPPVANLPPTNHACLLVPNNSDVIPVGFVDFLQEWMTEYHNRSGWKLAYLSVHKTYTQWVVLLPFEIQVDGYISFIRKLTSKALFEQFPDLKEKISGDDFWAPRHLALSGDMRIPVKLHKEYVTQTQNPQSRLAGDSSIDAPPPAPKRSKMKKGRRNISKKKHKKGLR